jgi:ribose 5-phosphate isomerase B
LRIAVGADHQGYALKQVLIKALQARGYQVKDYGTFSRDSVDYPDIAQEVGGAVSAGREERGLLICGTGIGMSIAANKVAGVRAALCHDVFTAQRAREHNDANVLCLSGATSEKDAELMMEAFLTTYFEGEQAAGERHARRVQKIARVERQADKRPA